ncbi:beta-propeller domain-containing protein [Pendulispora brunnea]|uniref:Beta-propeller domain-containing protein n=1 Tax=Pendulispora brunnea TaxID=2905690 RepID=A0ABZ2K7N9_9BACT
MKTSDFARRAGVLALLVATAFVGCKGACGREAEAEPSKASRTTAPAKLVAFGSRAEFEKYLADAAEAQKRKERLARRAMEGPGNAAMAPAPAASAASGLAAADKEESITNNQHAGVDEGGIVKVHGNHLIVLRRGRLFSLKVGDESLTPVSVADCYGPGVSPAGAWYDEMLVSGDTIAVIGYSYQRGGTEVGLFDIDGNGRISYRATYHLRSNDYYSSRNYASRLIGNKLVFYAPLYVPLAERDTSKWFPAVRRWSPAATANDFVSILEPSRVYRPIDPSDQLALHTVTTCDLSKGDFACTARAVMGPPGRVFYVSQDSVFVWMTPWASGEDGGEKRARSRSLLYRLPLSGEEPSVLRVSGGPIDQFSFLQGSDGKLNVLVRSETAGEAMWLPEATGGELALLRVPLASFNRAAEEAPHTAYTRLPKSEGYVMQNRFVGDYVLYGTGASWGYGSPKAEGKLVAYRYASDAPARELALGHGVDRIEAMGRDAVIVGGDGKDLHFSSVALGATPALGGKYTRTGAAQGELRSHGFFYKPDGDQRGIFGLPIRGGDQPGYAHLQNGSASILFVRNDRLAFREVGQLESGGAGNGRDDGCKASCVDWYGNARPIFLRGRVFALLGYEMVEGRQDETGRIREVRRMNFAPTGVR